jgi:hypothetical protein
MQTYIFYIFFLNEPAAHKYAGWIIIILFMFLLSLFEQKHPWDLLPEYGAFHFLSSLQKSLTCHL